MPSEGRGIFQPEMRKFFAGLLYFWALIQYIVLIAIMRETSQKHPLGLDIWLLPIVYLLPMALGISFRRQVRVFARNDLMSVKAASFCHDWIILLLLIVYLNFLDFTRLH
jgi:hypothetical protein